MKLRIIPNLLILLSVYHIRIVETKLQALSQDETPSTVSLGLCIIEITKLYMVSDPKMIAVTASLEDHREILFRLIETETSWSLVVAHINMTSPAFENTLKTSNYLIYINQPHELTPVLHALRNVISQNYRAKIIIVSATIFSDPQNVASGIIDILEQQGVTKALILLASENNATRYAIRYWHSYTKLTYRYTALPVNYCSFGSLNRYENGVNEIVTKCRTNCEVRVLYEIHPPYVIDDNIEFRASEYFTSQGFEIDLLNMIASHLNLSLHYRRTGDKWGDIYENGTATDDFRLLLNKSADILIGSYTKTERREMYLDLSIPYVHEYMVWCVPYTPIFQFRSLANIFTIKIWLLVVLVYFSVSVCVWVISVFTKKESATYKSLGAVFFNSFAVLLDVSVTILPKSIRLRLVMLLYILFAFTITLLYCSYLTSIISTPRYVQKYNSMGDVYHYNLTTYLIYNSVIRFTDDYDQVNGVPVSLIKERQLTCNNSTYCLEKVATSKTTAFCVTKLHKDYLMRNWHLPIHCINQNIVIFHINMIMRKGFPHAQVFNILINRIISSGFLAKWKGDLLRQQPRRNQFEADDYSITLKHLKPLFYIFMICMFSAFIVFVGELLV